MAIRCRATDGRKFDLDAKAGIRIACPDHSTVNLDRSFRDGKSEPHSTAVRVSRFFCPEEGIKDSLQELLGNTRSVIANGNSCGSLAQRELHVDCAVLGRMLNRISQNILHRPA